MLMISSIHLLSTLHTSSQWRPRYSPPSSSSLLSAELLPLLELLEPEPEPDPDRLPAFELTLLAGRWTSSSLSESDASEAEWSMKSDILLLNLLHATHLDKATKNYLPTIKSETSNVPFACMQGACARIFKSRLTKWCKQLWTAQQR